MPSDTETPKDWWERPEWKVLALAVALVLTMAGWFGNELLQGVRSAETSMGQLRERVAAMETSMEKRTERLRTVEQFQQSVLGHIMDRSPGLIQNKEQAPRP